jgi:hypothetical protein
MVTPQGPGKVKQVHVLRHMVTVQVEGPNDTATYVDVELPEPVIQLPETSCAGCGGQRPRAIISSDEIAVSEAAEPEEGVDAVEKIAASPSRSDRGEAQRQAGQVANEGQGRRSRARRRR